MNTAIELAAFNQLIVFRHWFGGWYGAEVLYDQFAADAGDPDPQPSHLLQSPHRLTPRRDKVRAEGMEIHHLRVAELFGLELPIDLVCYCCSHLPAGIPQREVHGPHHRESALGICQHGKSEIGFALYHTFITFIGLCQGPAGIILYLDPSIGSYFHLL